MFNKVLLLLFDVVDWQLTCPRCDDLMISTFKLLKRNLTNLGGYAFENSNSAGVEGRWVNAAWWCCKATAQQCYSAMHALQGKSIHVNFLLRACLTSYDVLDESNTHWYCRRHRHSSTTLILYVQCNCFTNIRFILSIGIRYR